MGLGFGAMVGVGLGATVGVGLGATVGVGEGWELELPPPHASSSTIRLNPSMAELTTTLILEVVIGENDSFRSTRLFPEILPPGTFTQLEPLQYCTLKLLSP